MVEIKWIKLSVSMFDDEKIKLIRRMPEGSSILLVWIYLLMIAGKTNTSGYIFLAENIPYTEEMLASVMDMPLNIVRIALKTFMQFEMINIDDNNYISISNWDKHQNIDGMDKIREQNRLRKQKQREKENALMAPIKEELGAGKSHVTSRDGHAIEEEVDIDIEEEVDIDIEEEVDIDIEEEVDIDIEGEEDIKETITSTTLTKENIETILNAWNKLELQQLKAINANTNRHKMLKARLGEYSFEEIVQAIESISKSKFLKGQNDRNWVITFDWFIKPNNFLKVLEGNYRDKVTEVNSVKNAQVQKPPKKKTGFHLANSRGDKYTAEELEALVLNNQKNRRGTDGD